MGSLQLKEIRNLLEKKGVGYELIEHAPVYTSEEAAKVRGGELKQGVKALVLEDDEGEFILALVPADRRVDLKKLEKILGVRRLRLASPSEVSKVTGCEVGSVHPFGNIAGLPTYMDREVLENEKVEFNAGLHTVSISMHARDLVSLVKPRIEDLAL